MNNKDLMTIIDNTSTVNSKIVRDIEDALERVKESHRLQEAYLKSQLTKSCSHLNYTSIDDPGWDFDDLRTGATKRVVCKDCGVQM